MKELYLKRWKENDWDELEERDTKKFLELEKEIYLEMFPHNASLFENNNEDEEECDQVAKSNNKWKRNSIEEVEIDDSSDSEENS